MTEKKTKRGKRIPITDAKKIAQDRGYSQVIVTAWDKDTGITTVCTYGETISDCEQAAEAGNRLKRVLGFPENLCNAKPSRSKK